MEGPRTRHWRSRRTLFADGHGAVMARRLKLAPRHAMYSNMEHARTHMHIGGLLYSREYTEHPVISPGPCTPTRRAHARTRLLAHYHYHIAHTHVARIRIS